MTDRKLASVQCVDRVSPIAGADRIECARILGWNVVVKKGEFKEGDRCVYFEVDSFLPVCEQFEFLRDSCYRKNETAGEGFRLQTQKFRGQISQGLVLPLSILPPGREYVQGDDVTELLGVRKWEMEEKQVFDSGIIGELPFGIPRTNEMRVQSYPELIGEFLAAPSYYITTKMDGTSVTMYWKDGKFGVCGRRYELEDNGKNPLWKYAKKHGIEEKLRAADLSDMAIQGEFCGPSIQKNRLKLPCPEWYVFTILDLQTFERLSLDEMTRICSLLELKQVPVEERGETFPYDTVEKLLERARGKYASGMHKEGIVIRPTEPVYSPTLSGPLSMKVLNNDQLLKE
ncbi:MAG: 2'-5' RNA ligase [Lachnospiraceae bacterium]|nr:2'-5' RNA ligase [Lachnospiraceae bacterium]